MPNRKLVLMVSILLTATAIAAQQHSYTQEDINAGAKLYESNCGNCHGENGDKIVGIDFGKGTFKTARTDDDIIRFIRNGVPNTGMPPSPLSEVQANTIVAFVRSMPNGTRINTSATPSLTGEVTRGKAIFEGKGNCASCHAISGVGGTSGPDLGAPAALRRCRRRADPRLFLPRNECSNPIDAEVCPHTHVLCPPVVSIAPQEDRLRILSPVAPK